MRDSMREIVIRLRLPQRPRARWLLGAIAFTIGVGAIVYAAVPNVFSTGEPLSAAKLNANFTSLDTRATGLENRATALEAPNSTRVYRSTNQGFPHASAGPMVFNTERFD